MYRLNLAADYGQWPFSTALHRMTAAQRMYIGATRAEHRQEEEQEMILPRDEWQRISDEAHGIVRDGADEL